MHELSIAESLIELATESVRDAGDVAIETVTVRIGPLAGVVDEALRFAFDVAREGTPCHGARLEIEYVDATAHCPRCEALRTLEPPYFRMRCPACGEPLPELLTGKELDLMSLQIIEHEAANA